MLNSEGGGGVYGSSRDGEGRRGAAGGGGTVSERWAAANKGRQSWGNFADSGVGLLRREGEIWGNCLANNASVPTIIIHVKILLYSVLVYTSYLKFSPYIP
jgi:hypothetical protein